MTADDRQLPLPGAGGLAVPDHLVEPSIGAAWVEGRLYGRLDYLSGKRRYSVTGEPAMREMARRLFPGCDTSRERLEFGADRRSVGDLNWFLLRFPLELTAAARIELAKGREAAIRHAHRRLSNADLSPITPPAEFRGSLRPFQAAGASYLAENQRTLLADVMGLGKTWTALGAAAHVRRWPALVVCQTHVLRQWQRVIGRAFDLPGMPALPDDMPDWDRWTARGEAAAPILRTRTPYTIPGTPFALIHYGLLADWRRKLLDYGFQTVIFDEAQELRHTGSLKYSAASELSSAAEQVWGLSGTPIYGYGLEIWNVMNALEFHCLGSRDAFTREWCTGYGERIVRQPAVLGDYLRREGLMLRRRPTDADVALDLPPVHRMVVDVDHDESLYREMTAAARAAIPRYHSPEWRQRGEAAREIERVTRRAAGLSKVHSVAEFVGGLIDAGERPLVYAWHHDVHDVLQEALADHRPAVFTGRETQRQKDDHMRRFVNGETPVAELSLRSAAGLDGLQHRATCCVFGELDWSPAIHCFDTKTEVLTPDGFSGVDHVHRGDLVAAFNIKTDSIQWVTATKKVDRRLRVGESMYGVHTHRIDLLVTGDHRMVTRRKRRTSRGVIRSEWSMATADDVSGHARHYAPLCGVQSAAGADLSSAQLQLIGLFLSDGNFNGTQLTIYQGVHQPWNDEIVNILDRSGVSWHRWKRAERRRGHDQWWYMVPKGGRRSPGSIGPPQTGWASIEPYLDKDLSPRLEWCSVAQLDDLIHGLWLGDGTKYKHESRIRRITNTNLTMLERLQSLCVRRGRPAILRPRSERTTAGRRVYDLCIGGPVDAHLQHSRDRFGSFHREHVPPGMRVWCLTNELGTLVVRRNGKVCVTGNSQCEMRISRMGVDEAVTEIPSYYCVSRSGYDEIILDVLGVKAGQFTGLMLDEPESQEEVLAAQEAAAARIKRLVDRFSM